MHIHSPLMITLTLCDFTFSSYRSKSPHLGIKASLVEFEGTIATTKLFSTKLRIDMLETCMKFLTIAKTSVTTKVSLTQELLTQCSQFHVTSFKFHI